MPAGMLLSGQITVCLTWLTMKPESPVEPLESYEVVAGPKASFDVRGTSEGMHGPTSGDAFFFSLINLHRVESFMQWEILFKSRLNRLLPNFHQFPIVMLCYLL